MSQDQAGTDQVEADDADVPGMAVDALRAAQRQARDSGRPVVVVADGELVRIGPEGQTVLRKLAPRRKVQVRRKRASA